MIYRAKATGPLTAITFLAMLLCSSSTLVEENVVGQKNKAFTVEELTIKNGETVDFLNGDSFFHNVFSLSDAKLFDLDMTRRPGPP